MISYTPFEAISSSSKLHFQERIHIKEIVLVDVRHQNTDSFLTQETAELEMSSILITLLSEKRINQYFEIICLNHTSKLRRHLLFVCPKCKYSFVFVWPAWVHAYFRLYSHVKGATANEYVFLNKIRLYVGGLL